MEKLVSIVVPGRNVSNTIEKCIVSIGKQDYSNVEVLVVLNGCTDDSLEVCRRLERSDKRIRVISSNAHSLLQARVDGVFASGGDWIAFVDADDMYVTKHAISKMYLEAEANNADICQFRHYRELPLLVRQKRPKTIEDKTWNSQDQRVILGMALGRDSHFTGYVWDKFYSSKVLKRGLRKCRTDCFFGEDRLFNAYILVEGGAHKVVSCRDAFYLYRRGGSTTGNVGLRLLEDYCNSKKAFLELLSYEPYEERIHSESLYCYRSVIRGLIKNGVSEKDVIGAIETVEQYPYIVEAKSYFRDRCSESDELRFMSSDYSAGEYLAFCAP